MRIVGGGHNDLRNDQLIGRESGWAGGGSCRGGSRNGAGHTGVHNSRGLHWRFGNGGGAIGSALQRE